MRTSGMKRGDLVAVDVRGATGMGRITGKRNDRKEIEIESFPVARNTHSYVPARWVTARQITDHYRKVRK